MSNPAELLDRGQVVLLVMVVPLGSSAGHRWRPADQQLLDTVEGVGLDDAELWSFRSRRGSASAHRHDLARHACRWMPSRAKTRTSMMVPLVPWSTRSEVSFTSEAFSPKMAREQLLFRGQRGLALGVTCPPARRRGRLQHRCRRCPTHRGGSVAARTGSGMSRVISSLPSLVSRALTTIPRCGSRVAVFGDDALWGDEDRVPRSCSRSRA